MRLSRIRLAGFKSFIDPTTFLLPSSRIAIVGPNGCGKSNTIDAVRWVLGESSARYLRGESLEDVIFNGSTTRKPVGQASVELIFDNADSALGGQYARFSEISVRRVASRDGQSRYFLNGSRCRRRDITDLFLGTGLGPRSYAIIDQGAIYRLIEAKPDELHAFLEEAAGISKYKERRRETEGHIRHTRENLARLNDLRDEVDKHLDHLRKQAIIAEQFKTLRQKERQLKWQSMRLRLNALCHETAARNDDLRQLRIGLGTSEARLRDINAQAEVLRKRLQACHVECNAIQEKRYEAAAAIGRIEQSIQQAENRHRQQLKDIKSVTAELQQIQKTLTDDLAQSEQLRVDLEQGLTLQMELIEQESRAIARQEDLEQVLLEWYESRDQFNRRSVEPAQLMPVEKIHKEYLQRQWHEYERQQERLQTELASLDDKGVPGGIRELKEQGAEQEKTGRQVKQKLSSSRLLLQKICTGIRTLEQKRVELRDELQIAHGCLASLEMLQDSALIEADNAVENWLEAHSLQVAPRLAEQIQVDKDWEAAVTNTLGPLLGAVCVNDLDQNLLPIPNPAPRIYVGQAVPSENVARNSLATKVDSRWSTGDLLRRVYLVDTIQEGMVRRIELQSGESFVTPEGDRIGKDWLNLAKRQAPFSGVLERNREIQHLQAIIQNLKRDDSRLQGQRVTEIVYQKEMEAECAGWQQEINVLAQAHVAETARLHALQDRFAQIKMRSAAIAVELVELAERSGRDSVELTRATRIFAQAQIDLQSRVDERRQLEQKRRQLEQVITQARKDTRHYRESTHAHALKLEVYKVSLQAVEQSLLRDQAREDGLSARVATLESGLTEESDPVEALRIALENRLLQRRKIDSSLHDARHRITRLGNEIRDADRLRLDRVKEIATWCEQIQQQQLCIEALRVREETLREQASASELDDLEEIALDPRLTLTDCDERLAFLSKRIQRLGSVNLVAIEEYQQENERSAYLVMQHTDLVTALEVLGSAIQKMDRETRGRFRDTFECINDHLGNLFPRLFGGGQARLQMSGDSGLAAGVTVLVKPPGKRLSTVHLMSGGEKALTAVALVFAIFELNPAPFCMLDEVDAPLDEANVGRFAQLVREMSNRVQFIMITHNKMSMEYADHLIGVTMHEPGVSRIVSVDLEKAMQMAAS